MPTDLQLPQCGGQNMAFQPAVLPCMALLAGWWGGGVTGKLLNLPVAQCLWRVMLGACFNSGLNEDYAAHACPECNF